MDGYLNNHGAPSCADGFLQQLANLAAECSRQQQLPGRRHRIVRHVLQSDLEQCQLTTAHNPTLNKCIRAASSAVLHSKLAMLGFQQKPAQQPQPRAGGRNLANANAAPAAATGPAQSCQASQSNIVLIATSNDGQARSSQVRHGHVLCACQRPAAAGAAAAADPGATTCCFSTLLVAAAPDSARKQEDGIIKALERACTASQPQRRLHVAAFGAAGLALKQALSRHHSKAKQAQLKQTLASVTFIAVPHLGTPCADVVAMSPAAKQCSSGAAYYFGAAASASVLGSEAKRLAAAGLTSRWQLGMTPQEGVLRSMPFLSHRVFVAALNHESAEIEDEKPAHGDVRSNTDVSHTMESAEQTVADVVHSDIFQRTFQEWFSTECSPLARAHDGLVSLPSALGLHGATIICGGPVSQRRPANSQQQTATRGLRSTMKEHAVNTQTASGGGAAQLAFAGSHADVQRALQDLALHGDSATLHSRASTPGPLSIIQSCFVTARVDTAPAVSSRPPRPRSPQPTAARTRSGFVATAFDMMKGAASSAVDGMRRTASFSSMSSFLSDISASDAEQSDPSEAAPSHSGPHVDTSAAREVSYDATHSMSFDLAGVSPGGSEAGPQNFPLSGRSSGRRHHTPAHDPSRRCLSEASTSLASGPSISLGSERIDEEEAITEELPALLLSNHAAESGKGKNSSQWGKNSSPWLLWMLVAICAAVTTQQLLRSDAGRILATSVFVSTAHACWGVWPPLRSVVLAAAQHSVLQPVAWLDGNTLDTMSRLQRVAGHVAPMKHGVTFFSAEKIGASLLPRAGSGAADTLFPHLRATGAWQAGLTGHPACAAALDGRGGEELPASVWEMAVSPAHSLAPAVWEGELALAAEVLSRIAAALGGTASPGAVKDVAAYVKEAPQLCALAQPLSYEEELRLDTLQGAAAAALQVAMPAAGTPGAKRVALQGVLLPLALLLRSVRRSDALHRPPAVTPALLAEVQRLFPPLPWLVSTAPHPLRVRLTRGRELSVPANTPILLYADTSNRDPVEFGGAFSSALHAAAPAWALPPSQRSQGGEPLGCLVSCGESARSLPWDAAAGGARSAAHDSLADRVLEMDDLSWKAWGWLCGVAAVWLWTCGVSAQSSAAPLAAAAAGAAHSHVLLYLLSNAASALAWCASGREHSLGWAALQLASTACLARALFAACRAVQPANQAPATPPTRARRNTLSDNPSAQCSFDSLLREKHRKTSVSRASRRRSISESSAGSMSGWTDTGSEYSAAEPVSAADMECLLLSAGSTNHSYIRRQSYDPGSHKVVNTRETPELHAAPAPVPCVVPKGVSGATDASSCCSAGAGAGLLIVGASVLAMQLALVMVSPGCDLHPTTAAGQVCMLALVLFRSAHAVRAQVARALDMVALASSHPRAATTVLAAAGATLYALPLLFLQGRAFFVLTNALNCCLWLPAVAAGTRLLGSDTVQQRQVAGDEAVCNAKSVRKQNNCCSTVRAAAVSPWLPVVVAAGGITAVAAAAGGALLFLQTAALCNWSAQAAAAVRVGGAMPAPAFSCPNCPVDPPQATPPHLLPGVCDGQLDGLLHQLDAHTKLMYHLLTLQNDLPQVAPTGKAVGSPQWHHPLRRANTAVGVPVLVEDEDDAVSPIPNFVNNAALQVLRAREVFGEARVADDATQFESLEQARAFLNVASRGGARLPPPLVAHSDLLSDVGLTKIAFSGLGAHLVRRAGPRQVAQLMSLPGLDPARLPAARIVYMSDVRKMGAVEVRGGFARMGACAVFDDNGTAVGIVVNDIAHARHVEEGAWVLPGDTQWSRAKFVWRSSLVVAVTVMDHLVGAHMVANTVNAAVREALPTAHPVRRLLRPGDFMSVWINQGAIPTLLSQNDVLHRTLALTRRGQLSSIRRALRAAKWTSVQDNLQQRGMSTAPAWLYPYGSDLKQFDAVVRRFVRGYLGAFFPDGRVNGDAALMAWMEQLQGGYPSVHVPGARDLDSVVEVLTTIIVHESQHHMQVGRVTSYVTDPALAASKLTSSNMADVQSAMQMFLVASVTNSARPMLMGNYDHLVPKRNPEAYFAAVEVWGRFRKELCQLAHAIDTANAQADEDASGAVHSQGMGALGHGEYDVQAAPRRWPTNGANPKYMAAGVSI